MEVQLPVIIMDLFSRKNKEAEMKRLSKMFGAILFSAVLILSFTACGTSNETKVSRKAGDESSKQQESVTEKPVQDDAEEDNQKPSEEESLCFR